MIKIWKGQLRDKVNLPLITLYTTLTGHLQTAREAHQLVPAMMSPQVVRQMALHIP